MKDRETVYVGMSANEGFAFYAAIGAFSIRQNLSKKIDLELYFVDNGLKGVTKKKLGTIFETFNIKCIWLYPDKTLTNKVEFPEGSWLDDSSLLRLLMPQMLPDYVDKLIYVDGDMLVLDDISLLYNVDLEGNIMAACQDFQYNYIRQSKSRSVYADYEISGNLPYLNAGLYVIDVKKWNSNNLTDITLDILIKRSKELSHSDQDAINIALAENWKILNPKWNVVTPMYFNLSLNDKLLTTPSIIHFTGPKPGQPGCKHPKRFLYFDYVKKSNFFTPIEYIMWRLNTSILRTKVQSRIALGGFLRKTGIK
ncbi:glycosyltransferase family 8 protein [Winogradskyella sediminis]|uniref:Lipopolysaccharide biosynthesis protein, LPS:glycosyltransferase n=1 Tax=Winogradskyella sediminis TaxID=1382466 RepID=A0A1H1PU04_9FLAO|nr:glycosyltransferase [Winogradskyella sediminis]SDS14821.1 Lipopolysaccharide biosynthesis protein, LPS:glycosyltransferase [Winogradskyella sediminis]